VALPGETHTDVERQDARDAEWLRGVLRDGSDPALTTGATSTACLANGSRASSAPSARSDGASAQIRMMIDYVLRNYIPAAGGTSCDTGHA
jgi:hypothetical protein